MTPDEHQRERMRHWSASFLASTALCAPHQNADMALAEFDKRFPAPSAAAPVEPVPVPDQSAMGMAVSSLILDQTAELDALRQKARLFDKLCEELPPGWKQHLRCWDAVASGKVRLSVAGRAYCTWALGSEMTPLCDTAEEAVESAIAQGALK